MAGLYVKELMLSGDLARCLVVAPGSLVEQWQEELYDKFGLRFEVLNRSMIDESLEANVFRPAPAADRADGSAVPVRRAVGEARKVRGRSSSTATTRARPHACSWR